jgi:NADH-quinone oxidoreductase subunit J
VAALAGTAAIFLLLSAEFVAWVLVLVYIGAVIVLFLFGIMITRAPTGTETRLDHENRFPAVVVSLTLFVVLSVTSVVAFGDETLPGIGTATGTDVLGDSLFGRFVVPFEVISFVLLAALIGGITVARKDASPAEEAASPAELAAALRAEGTPPEAVAPSAASSSHEEDQTEDQGREELQEQLQEERS